MNRLDEKTFLNIVDEHFQHVRKVPLMKNIHYNGNNTLSNGYKLFGGKVYNQYIGRINSPLKIRLGDVVRRLSHIEATDDPFRMSGNDVIYPEHICDDLIRLGELLREDNKLFAYVDNRNNDVYGVVSDRHTPLQDKVVYQKSKDFFDAVGLKYDKMLYHDIYGMRANFVFEDLQLDIGQQDNVKYMIVVRNSPYGHGALSGDAGFLRMICSNGVFIWDKTTTRFSESHIISDKVLIGRMFDYIGKALSHFDRLADKITQAAEITDPWLDPELSLVNWLPDNYNVLVREAEEVLRLMKINSKYINTSFWIGQAIAEVARDSPFDDQIRLEEEAGRIMLAQVLAK